MFHEHYLIPTLYTGNKRNRDKKFRYYLKISLSSLILFLSSKNTYCSCISFHEQIFRFVYVIGGRERPAHSGTSLPEEDCDENSRVPRKEFFTLRSHPLRKHGKQGRTVVADKFCYALHTRINGSRDQVERFVVI